MKTFKPLLGFLLILAIVFSCQKEKSYEKSNAPASAGSLQDSTNGDCLGHVVSGTYKKDTSLNSLNYVDINIDVTRTGSYTVSSDTINGIYFKATGNFNTTGVSAVRLLGYGTPVAAGTNIFTVTYDSTPCTFSVVAADGGTGGTSVFTLAGAPNACTGATVQGIFTAGTATTAANTATVQVDVTTAGTYSISTDAVNGVQFKGSGTLAATGAQTITLTATGTPVAAGTFTIPISVGTQCSFQITVVGASPAVYTLNGAPNACTGATVQGQYVVGTLLSTSNTATIQVNVTTAGSYSITTAPAVDGVAFAGSGNFSTTGVQSVILIATGTPTDTGSVTVPITVGSSTCSFILHVVPVDYFPRTTNSNWSYEFDNNSSDTLFQQVISPTLSASGNTYNIFMENDGTGLDTLGYFRRSGGNYYQYLDIGSFFQLDNPAWGEYIFLEDNVPANTSWTSSSFNDTYTDTTGATYPIIVHFKETIQQKDVPITVQGIPYQNTIVVKEEYEYSFDNGTTWSSLPFYTTNYYSRNIGLIKSDFTDNSGSGGSYTQDMTRYQVF
ncbi:MAG TPA: hypothetical protein VGI82_14590 [Chitinophagaceae bacterium]